MDPQLPAASNDIYVTTDEIFDGEDKPQNDGKASSLKASGELIRLPFQSIFEVKFENAAHIKTDKVFSEVVTIGPFKWRLILFPKGNSSTNSLSVFLDVADAEELEYGWKRSAEFTLTLVNLCAAKNIQLSGIHTFCIQFRDRGFSDFMRDTRRVWNKSDGFLVDGALTFSVKVTVNKIWDELSAASNSLRFDQNYHSKRDTGFVGLRNQGATCYLNSFIQSIFHMPYFRATVYAIPTDPHNISIPHALQTLFWKLETSHKSVSTTDLTASFGWKSEQLLMQHDIQELARLLEENLEKRMKNTTVEGTIEKLFQGQLQSCLRCVDVVHQSIKDEVFYDISLNIHSSLYESLDSFTEVEKLDEANKWKPNEQLGLQTAEKFIRFKSLPPVLHLHLKRFDYDWDIQSYVKDNSKLVFPPELDLGPYMVSPVPTLETLYSLHGVLVHSGSMNGGHYYAFLRPYTDHQWYQFDDTLVKKVSVEEAIDDNFGGNEVQLINWRDGKSRKITNEKSRSAYMLVYIRKSDQDWVFGERKDLKSDFLDRMRASAPIQDHEITKKEAEHEHDLYSDQELELGHELEVIISFNADIEHHKQIGLMNIESCSRVKISEEKRLEELMDEVETLFGIPRNEQQLWKVNTAPNSDIVLSMRPFTIAELNNTIGYMAKMEINPTGRFAVYIYLGMPTESDSLMDEDFSGQNESNNLLFDPGHDYKLVFLKIYDPATNTLNFVHKFHLKPYHTSLFCEIEKILLENVGCTRAHLDTIQYWYLKDLTLAHLGEDQSYDALDAANLLLIEFSQPQDSLPMSSAIYRMFNQYQRGLYQTSDMMNI